MNPYLLVLGLGLIAMIQVGLLPPLLPIDPTPDLVLVIVVGWALLRDSRAALPWAVIGGLWLDLLAGGPFGLYTLGLLVAAAVGGLGGDTIYRGHLILAPILAAAATLARSAVQLLLLLILGQKLALGETMFRLVLPEAGLNALLIVLVHPLLAWLSRISGRFQLPLE